MLWDRWKSKLARSTPSGRGMLLARDSSRALSSERRLDRLPRGDIDGGLEVADRLLHGELVRLELPRLTKWLAAGWLGLRIGSPTEPVGSWCEKKGPCCCMLSHVNTGTGHWVGGRRAGDMKNENPTDGS